MDIVVRAAGAVVGYFVSGGSPYGAYVGWTLAGVAYDSTHSESVQGPRLDASALKAPKLQYSARWPRIYGRHRTAGIILWQSELREVATETDNTTSFNYYRDILVGIAEGNNPDCALPRVWRNSKLIWSQLATSSPETLAASVGTDAWSDIRLYNGAPDQLPDPVYEASVGTPNALAYRHRVTAFIEGVNQGGVEQLPFLEYEYCSVVEPGSGAFYAVPIPTGEFYTFEHGGLFAKSSADGSLAEGFLFGAYQTNSLGLFSPFAHRMYVIDSSPTMDLPGDFELEFEMKAGYAPGGGSDVHHPWSRIERTTGEGVNTVGLWSFRNGFAGSGTMTFTASGSSGIPQDVTATGLVVNVWQEWKARRVGTVLTLWLNGVLVDTAPNCTADLSGVCKMGINGVYQTTSPLPNTFHGPNEYRNFVMRRGLDTVTPLTVDLADVVSAEHLRANDNAPEEFDVSELVGHEVVGIALGGSAREGIETLRAAYYFDAVCADKVYYRMRGGASSAAMPFADTAAGSDKASDTPFTGPHRENDNEIAAKVHFTYTDVDADYDNGTEQADRLIGGSNKIDQVSLPIVLTRDRAKGIVETIAADGRIGSMTAKVQWSDQYARLEPTDIVSITDDAGNIYSMRVVESMYSPGVYANQLVLDDAAVLQYIGIPGENYTPPVIDILPNGTAELVLLDIPILGDVDNATGHYAAAMGSGNYRGSVLGRSMNGVLYSVAATFTEQGTIGVASTTLASFAGGNVVDHVSTVRVSVGNRTLASTTLDSMLDSFDNAFALGIDGRWEIAQFQVATLISTDPNVYDLSVLLRGRRGTGHNIGNHAVNDEFVLLPTSVAGLRRVSDALADTGALRYFKLVPSGGILANANAEMMSNDQVGLKPFAPVNVRANRDSPSEILVTWDRRTRLSADFVNGASVPLGETSEAYDIEVYNGAGVLQSTARVTQPQASISAAATGFARVYQISASVWRGYPAEIDL